QPRAQAVGGFHQVTQKLAVVHQAQGILDLLVRPLVPQPVPRVRREDEALGALLGHLDDLAAQVGDASHGYTLQSIPAGISMWSDAGSGKRSPAAPTAGRMSATKARMHPPQSLFFRPFSIANWLPGVPGRPKESIPSRSHFSKSGCLTSSNPPDWHCSTTIFSPRPWCPASSLTIFWMTPR